eukprot:3937746-Rhodomonas_salina.4
MEDSPSSRLPRVHRAVIITGSSKRLRNCRAIGPVSWQQCKRSGSNMISLKEAHGMLRQGLDLSSEPPRRERGCRAEILLPAPALRTACCPTDKTNPIPPWQMRSMTEHNRIFTLSCPCPPLLSPSRFVLLAGPMFCASPKAKTSAENVFGTTKMNNAWPYKLRILQ